jgi:hypothetical protein
MSRKRQGLAVAAAALLAGGGMTLAVTVSGQTVETGKAAPELPSPQTSSNARLVAPTDALKATLGGDLAEEFALSFDRTTQVAAPATAKTGAWTIVPGAKGVCVVFGEAAFNCAPIEAFNDGRFSVLQLAAAQGPMPRDLEKASEEQILGSGEGHLRRVVPKGYSKVIARDRSGKQIAAADVHDQVYDLVIPNSQSFSTAEVVTTNGITKGNLTPISDGG